jgi:hypothetical protein
MLSNGAESPKGALGEPAPVHGGTNSASAGGGDHRAAALVAALVGGSTFGLA